MTSYMIKHSKLIPKTQKKLNFLDRVTRYGYFSKWCLLKELHFQDIQSEGIILGPKAKFLVMKNWSSEVVLDFCFCLF